MPSFQRSSPSLHQILLRLYRDSSENAIEIDHRLHEFGSVEYHIQSSASHPQLVYLSISTPLLSHGGLLSERLSSYTVDMVKKICSEVVDVIEPSKEGYQLTLRLDFTQIPQGKETMIITEISAVKAVILSSQLKEILRTSDSDVSRGMCKPIKLVYHPREQLFVIKQKQKLKAVFPMRFKESTDVIIATAFFLELMDVGNSEKWSKAPTCSWSPIPPPELIGEPIEDLSTNGGFVSFDISWRHLKGQKLDKTLWSLLNFHAYVKHHVKTTKGFIQRTMRKRLECLIKVLRDKGSKGKTEQIAKAQDADHGYVKKLVSKTKILKQICTNMSKKIKRIRSRIKILGFRWFRRRLLKRPKFSSSIEYTKLD